MRTRRREAPTLDLDALPADVRRAVEAAMTGAEIAVRRGGRVVGSLEFHAEIVEGVVLASRLPQPEVQVPDGATVVATAMRLSDSARRRLADELGDGYVVLDLPASPASTDVVLVNAVSPQLLGVLRERFPSARVIVTEIDDEELGVAYDGPVRRLLDAGAAAYLPPRDIRGVATNVHAYLTEGTRPELTAARADAAAGALPRAIAPEGRG